MSRICGESGDRYRFGNPSRPFSRRLYWMRVFYHAPFYARSLFGDVKEEGERERERPKYLVA